MASPPPPNGTAINKITFGFPVCAICTLIINTKRAGFMKTVPLTLMSTIYLTHNSIVTEVTIFRKQAVVYSVASLASPFRHISMLR